MNLEEIKYDAFISYRHTELDQFAAVTLHKELEAFRLPKAILKQLEKKGIGKKKIERVFRDRDELPITNNLADPITNALRNADFLLVICSPRLKESLWCRKEIETFISMHGREHVFAVLIEGEPAESFPEELLYEEKKIFNENGEERIERIPIEPLAADIRGKNKKEMRKKIKEEVLRLAAPMFGCSYDDLKQRHKERFLRRVITAACVISTIFGSFGLISTTMALRIQKQSQQIQEQSVEIQAQAEQIEIQYQEALKTNARQLAEDAFDYMDNGDMTNAIKTAYDALTQVDGADMPYTAEAEYALSTALQTYRNGSQILPQRLLVQDSQINFCKLSPDKKTLMIVDIFGNLSVYDPLTGNELYHVEMTGNTTYLSEGRVCFVGNTQIAYPTENSLVIYNFESKELREFENDWSSDLWADNNGDYLAVVDYDEMTIYDAEMMEPVFEMQLDSGESFQIEGEFSKKSPGLFAVEYNTLERACGFLLINVEEQTFVKKETPLHSITDMYFDEGDFFYCGYYDMDTIQGSLYCTDLNGNVKWEHSVDGLPKNILTFGEEKEDKLAYTKYGAMVVLYKEDGSLMAQEDLGREITNYCGYVNSDYLTLMTREGEYYYYSPITEMATTYVGKFVTNSDNLKEFYFGNGYFVSVAHVNNSAAVYQFAKGKNLNLLVESDDMLMNSKMSPSGEYMVSEIYGTGYSQILVSNVSDGSQVAEIVLEDSICDFDINVYDELVVITRNSVEIYSLEDGTVLQKESTSSENSRLINGGQAYVTYEEDKVYIKDVKSQKVLNEVAEKRIVKNGLFASTVDEMGEYYAFCDEDNKKIIIGSFAGDFSIEIPINVNAIESLSLAPQAKAIFITYLDENVEAYDITTGNLLTSYGILEGGVEDVTELTNIHCMLLKNINNAYLVNDQLEVIAFLQGYTDYSEKNDSFILDDSYYVYEVKRRQLEDLLNDAELYLAK